MNFRPQLQLGRRMLPPHASRQTKRRRHTSLIAMNVRSLIVSVCRNQMSSVSRTPLHLSNASASAFACVPHPNPNPDPTHLSAPQVRDVLHDLIAGLDGLRIQLERPLRGDQVDQFVDRLDVRGFQRTLLDRAEAVGAGHVLASARRRRRSG